MHDQLEAGVRELNLELPASAFEQLLNYQAELQKWNAAYNLTAVRDPSQMVTRHLLDSLALLPSLSRLPSPVSRLLDVGSGAGLPGIVLAIVRPGLNVTTLDSNGKKTRFMRHAARTLDLANVEVVENRVEAYAPAVPFECIVSRAFASLADFFDKTAHLLAPGGQWMAMKGKLDVQELAGIPAGIQIRETPRLQVPGLDEERHVVVASSLTPHASRT
ncbi:MAG: 16S rRNA (guanine(527)-N(7))-methyltransferase RsmG [Stenotrophobium sp.]